MWPLKTGFHSFLLNLRHFNATILIFYPSFCDVPEEGSLFSLVNSLRDLNHDTGFILQLWSCLLGRKGETVPPSPPMHPRKQPSALFQGRQHPLPPADSWDSQSRPHTFLPSQFKSREIPQSFPLSSLPVSHGPYVTSKSPSGNAICSLLFVVKYVLWLSSGLIFGHILVTAVACLLKSCLWVSIYSCMHSTAGIMESEDS